ncbi:outer membrane protein assembly factor BamB [Aquincola sp. S2]|uniref:Outer membrane protein assembly factor BamB n=1 Tax=Pseudaquabacterium terrae TaxID=2732868 RepID=A0ABX2EJ53_9BURK|nr:outer membrane protein assembly factor BamB [Aquabacterium terrae]NRF68602.1 outer membrane protein assembly factor BamB [Aquabacterium terrae]
MTRLVPLVLIGAALLAACSSTDKPKPTPLEAVTPQIAGRQVWSARLDGVQFPMQVTVRDGAFVVASTGGSVVALDAQSGRELWRGEAGSRVAAGVGSDGRFAAVVTQNNELVVLERGKRLWTAALSSRTTTSPLVAGERVFVIGVDRVVHAFDALDGRRLWTYRRTGEPLTLAQPGVLAAYKDTLLTGQGASLVGLDPLKGTLRWDVPVTSPRGTNEVERLNDLVGPALRVGDTVCARAFQSAVGCIAANTTSLRWSRLGGGQNGVGGDADLVFGADASDRITAWRTASGDTAWTNERLLHRDLSAPLSTGRTVVFGDGEGQVHFLAREDGKTLLRLPTDGSPIVGAPALAGTTMLVVTRNGGLFAFRPE